MKKLATWIWTSVVAILVAAPLVAQGIDTKERLSVRAFYADSDLQHVVAIDVDTMGQIAFISTYRADDVRLEDKEILDDIHAITRRDDPYYDRGSDKMEALGLIELDDYCDSADDHNLVLGLRLISDANRPVTSIIEVETDEVIASIGCKALPLTPGDYDGADVTGHPFWFTHDKFALIDRVSRSIETYQVTRKDAGWRVSLVDTVSTSSPIDHFIKRDRSVLDDRQRHTYYALTKGDTDQGLPPSLLKYLLIDDSLHLMVELPLVTEDIDDREDHHVDIHPDGSIMYIRATNGHTHVVDMQRMRHLKTFELGMDVEQMTFVPDRDIAVLTGHDETFVSIIDTGTHQKIKDVRVSESSVNGRVSRSHTGFVSQDSDFFYAYTTVAGLFYKMDLETLEIERTLKIGATPLRANNVGKERGHRTKDPIR